MVNPTPSLGQEALEGGKWWWIECREKGSRNKD